jgi:hypothetical protein
MPAGGLQRFFERRWPPPQRLANFCSLTGALTGLFTFGLVPISIFLFPMVMARSIMTAARWGWMPQLKEGEKPRRGLGLLFLAPLLFILLVYPIIYLVLIPLSVILTPIVALYHSHRGRLDDASMDLAGIVSSVAVLAIYFWLLARSLKRFTGAWHSGLFVRLVAWICGLIAVGILLVSQINFMLTEPLFSATYFGLFLLWFFSTLAFSKAGAVFGLWLTRCN